MKLQNTLASAMIALSLIAAPAVFAADATQKNPTSTTKKMDMHEFMKECDMDHDGMMSKAEMLKHMEKMFDKVDVKRSGKLDKTQTEQFLKQFNIYGGG